MATPIWTLLNSIRGEGSELRIVPEMLASLIVLRWVDFQEAEREAVAEFDSTPYEPVVNPRLRWGAWHSLQGQRLGEFLDQDLRGTLSHIGAAVRDPLAAQLSMTAEAIEELLRLPFAAQQRLVEWVSAQPFETPGERLELLSAFDQLLDEFSDSKNGLDRTPASVAQLVASLSDPKPGDRVYDPCFGTAGLLTAVADLVRRKERDGARLRGSLPLDVAGIDTNPHSALIGLTRLILSGIEEPRIELGNSLEREFQSNPGSEGFDLVVANPPWGAKMDPRGLGHLPIQTSDSSALFVQHALGQLKPGGRAIVVVPQGTLFRGGADRAFRRWLLETHAIEGVVSLGSGAFLPFTSVQASVLCLRRGTSSNRVRFVDAEALFERSRSTKGKVLSSEGIEKITLAFHSPTATEISWDISIAEIASLDWDLSPKRRGQSDFASLVRALSSEMPVMPLAEVCTVTAGINVKSEDMLQTQVEGSVPLIRVKDLERGVVSRGSVWIDPARRSIGAGHVLRGGDILLSKSGTIGKAGIVRNGAIGAVASSGLYEIHVASDQLDPNYLLAYLSSPDCRSWLTDQATGSTIQHLPIGAIRDLPVPIPPLQLQLRVSEQFREQGTDALGFLGLITNTVERDPITEWLESAILRLPQDSETTSEPLNFQPLERLLSELRPIRNRVAHGADSGPLANWLIIFHEALSRLQGVQLVPPGPSLLNVLQAAATGVQKSLAALGGRLPSEARARTLAGTVLRMISTGIDFLLDQVKVTFSAEEETVWAGDYNIIHVDVQNDGPLPLRDLSISTLPDWGTSDIAFLAEGGTTRIQLDGDIASEAEAFQIEFSWSGKALDGRPVEGGRQLAFDVDSKNRGSFHEPNELGPSPYVCGNPVGPGKSVFFGREEIIADIRSTVQEKGNVVLLEGNRRAGKSSILAHLEGVNGIPGWLCVNASLQATDGDQTRVGVPTHDVFRALAKAISNSLCLSGLSVPLPNGELLEAGTKLNFQTRLKILEACRQGIPEEGSFSYFREFLTAGLEVASAGNLGIVLMLDEFDKLQEGIDSGVTSPQVPENIRNLVQTLPRFSAILTGSRRIRRLRQEYWSALFGLGTAFAVTALSEEAAIALVQEPVKGRLTWSKEATHFALNATARQPYILQCLCNEVFLLASETGARTITIDFVRKASNSDTLWQHFASLWVYPANDRRRFILALCDRYAAEGEPFTYEVLKESLSQNGVKVLDADLDSDIDDLLELELLHRTPGRSGATYRLETPLMGEWIRTAQDFNLLKLRAQAFSADTDSEDSNA